MEKFIKVHSVNTGNPILINVRSIIAIDVSPKGITQISTGSYKYTLLSYGVLESVDEIEKMLL